MRNQDIGRMSRRAPGTSSRAGRRATPIESLIVLLLLAVLVFAAALPALRGRTAAAPTARVVVLDRDSLWTIARAHPVPGQGTARTVALIRRLNGLERADLTPGTVLLVPAAPAAGASFASR